MKGSLDRPSARAAIAAIAALAIGLYMLLEVADLDDYLPSLLGLASSASSVAASALQAGGWPAVLGLMVLESASLPIPSEVVLPLAGYLAYRGAMDPLAAYLAALAGSMIGSYADYYIGKALGMELLRKRVWVSEAALRRAEEWFRRYGEPMVIITRLVPGARTLISFPAGALGMDAWRFGLYTLAGSAAWSAILMAAGYYLGASWERAVPLLNWALLAAALAVAIGASVYLYLASRRRAGLGVSQ